MLVQPDVDVDVNFNNGNAGMNAEEEAPSQASSTRGSTKIDQAGGAATAA
jgi:hypothetical protein